MRSSFPNRGEIINVRLNISLIKLYSILKNKRKNFFSFDSSHKFEETLFTIDCI